MAEKSVTNPIKDSGFRPWQNAGPPSSGTSGTLAGKAIVGALLHDVTNAVLYINEGTQLSPYWTPVGLDQWPLYSVNDDWRSQIGKTIANTDAEAFLASGVRVFGQGVTETDSGLVIQAAGEGGILARMTTTDEAEHTLAIGLDAGVMQPDQHSLLVVEADIAHVSAITARALFLGFVGLAPDAIDPVVTGATTVATLVQDNLAGIWFDTGLTDPDRYFGVHNKADEDATQDLEVDGDTETDVEAAGTFQRLRVEINSAGAMTVFVDKVQVYTFATALDVDEEVSPVLYLESQASAVKEADVKRFATWAMR